ncbi:MAG TPA: hypothetical protein VGC98_13375, partial [Thermoleophilaceae bacterium]
MAIAIRGYPGASFDGAHQRETDLTLTAAPAHPRLGFETNSNWGCGVYIVVRNPKYRLIAFGLSLALVVILYLAV